MSRGSKICIAILFYLAVVIVVKLWLFPSRPFKSAAPTATRPADSQRVVSDVP